MNKTVLRNFATKARKELIERVELQARKIGITKDKIEQASVESSDAVFINGKQLTDIERIQRNKLIARIEEIGFDRVIEETAYTWFNRFIALRFMEVNDYLPTRVRVLSSENENSTEPDMIREALSLDLDIDKEYVYNLKMENNTDELFKYLILLHCNDLNRYMPFMFETIEDYMAILFPEGLLGSDSFVRGMINTEVISEEYWKKIEIIGWLYQFYIEEEKNRVFKTKKKYEPEEIPFVTQLFTPDWIVQYMVQNSLGRYWIESHPEHKDLISNWQFFIEREDEEFEQKIAPYVNKELKVEDIKCFDPAMGSGHILVYMFEVLYEIYLKSGYLEREIPRLIIENNLFGLDIDDRAYQLACFSVVMKSLEYNKRFLRSIERNGLILNLASIQETNNISLEDIQYLAGESEGENFEKIHDFIDQFKFAKTIGSLLKIDDSALNIIIERYNIINSSNEDDIFNYQKIVKLIKNLPNLIKQTNIMSEQYDVIVTNPPYMNPNKNKNLSDYVKKHYPDSKTDLFAAFMEIDHNLKENGFYAMINQHSWMFLSSYEKLRKKIIENKFLDTMLHLGPRAFEEIGGEVVQSTTFTLRNTVLKKSNGSYIRLVDERTASEKKGKAIEAVQNPNVSYRYTFSQENFGKIPGSPIAYWVTENMIKNFSSGSLLKEIGDTRQGMATSDNNRFLRLWYEVTIEKIGVGCENADEALMSFKKWFPYNKGGHYRKWYGNNEFVINYENDGHEVKEYARKLYKTPTRTIKSVSEYFKPSLSWSKISSGNIAFRFYPAGYIFDVAGCSIFLQENKYMNYMLGFLNSIVSQQFLLAISPTLNYEAGHIASLPFIIKEQKLRNVDKIVENCINISKNDWDTFEFSRDFKKHPLLNYQLETIKSSFSEWETFAENQFKKLKENEKELNRIFIDIYGLQDELTPDIADEDVTIRKADLERDIKSFISYAVGCAFGRYSLDEDGLIYAGGEFDSSKYQTFPADEDNILPVLPGAYFEDDIVNRFIQFVEVTYGNETLEENLQFIADAIGQRRNETARETIRRYFLNDFYKDHVKTYKKRPIYWLFTSGKEKAFNCLIYMHRYDKTTLSKIRTDYLHEVQTRYEAIKQDLITVIESESSAKEVREAKKELKDVEKKIAELKQFDEKLHHMADMQIEIDLDDGVKENHKKFDGLVAKI